MDARHWAREHNISSCEMSEEVPPRYPAERPPVSIFATSTATQYSTSNPRWSPFHCSSVAGMPHMFNSMYTRILSHHSLDSSRDGTEVSPFFALASSICQLNPSPKQSKQNSKDRESVFEHDNNSVAQPPQWSDFHTTLHKRVSWSARNPMPWTPVLSEDRLRIMDKIVHRDGCHTAQFSVQCSGRHRGDHEVRFHFCSDGMVGPVSTLRPK